MLRCFFAVATAVFDTTGRLSKAYRCGVAQNLEGVGTHHRGPVVVVHVCRDELALLQIPSDGGATVGGQVHKSAMGCPPAKGFQSNRPTASKNVQVAGSGCGGSGGPVQSKRGEGTEDSLPDFAHHGSEVDGR